RGGDHEDDQEHQHHVDERRDVDLVSLDKIVAAAPRPSADCLTELRAHRSHSVVYSAARARRNPPRSPSRLIRSSTMAEASPSSARWAAMVRVRWLKITPAGIAATRPSAVASNASAMPGATTARLVVW